MKSRVEGRHSNCLQGFVCVCACVHVCFKGNHQVEALAMRLSDNYNIHFFHVWYLQLLNCTVKCIVLYLHYIFHCTFEITLFFSIARVQQSSNRSLTMSKREDPFSWKVPAVCIFESKRLRLL